MAIWRGDKTIFLPNDDDTRFEPHTFFADGNKVFALIAIDATQVASGKQYKFSYEGHLWFFNDAGKVVKYQHVTDTALHQRAAKGE